MRKKKKKSIKEKETVPKTEGKGTNYWACSPWKTTNSSIENE